jgi:hypothetical protein
MFKKFKSRSVAIIASAGIVLVAIVGGVSSASADELTDPTAVIETTPAEEAIAEAEASKKAEAEAAAKAEEEAKAQAEAEAAAAAEAVPEEPVAEPEPTDIAEPVEPAEPAVEDEGEAAAGEGTEAVDTGTESGTETSDPAEPADSGTPATDPASNGEVTDTGATPEVIDPEKTTPEKPETTKPKPDEPTKPAEPKPTSSPTPSPGPTPPPAPPVIIDDGPGSTTSTFVNSYIESESVGKVAFGTTLESVTGPPSKIIVFVQFLDDDGKQVYFASYEIVEGQTLAIEVPWTAPATLTVNVGAATGVIGGNGGTGSLVKSTVRVLEELPPSTVETRVVDGEIDCDSKTVAISNQERTVSYVYVDGIATPEYGEWKTVSEDTRPATLEECPVVVPPVDPQPPVDPPVVNPPAPVPAPPVVAPVLPVVLPKAPSEPASDESSYWSEGEYDVLAHTGVSAGNDISLAAGGGLVLLFGASAVIVSRVRRRTN